jgi:hypothetical protein
MRASKAPDWAGCSGFCWIICATIPTIEIRRPARFRAAAAHTEIGDDEPMNMAAPLLAPASPPPLAAPVTHDVTIVTTRKLAQARVLGVPPEEFGIERGARSIRDCNYCFHEVVTKTESQLIAEGFDEEQIKSLGDYTGNTDIETLARDSVGENFGIGAGAVNSAARLVRRYEPDKLMGYFVALYFGKLLVWDKVLGLGTTDPLAGFASVTSNLVVSFYFAKRGFENVARIIKR